MSTHREPDHELDVVERGTYTENGDGPALDTAGFHQSTPMGMLRRPMASGPPKASGSLLSRDKLARGGAVIQEDEAPGFEFQLWHAVLAASLLALILSAGFAVWLASGGEVEGPQEVVEELNDTPTEIDGIPVQKGIRR